VIYTPTAGYVGSDSFKYTIGDGHGGTSSATVDLTINSINHAPTAVADSLTGTSNTQLTVTTAQLLINDTDPDGDKLAISSVLDATNGTVALVGGNVVFTPTKDYVATPHSAMSSAMVTVARQKPPLPSC